MVNTFTIWNQYPSYSSLDLLDELESLVLYKWAFRAELECGGKRRERIPCTSWITERKHLKSIHQLVREHVLLEEDPSSVPGTYCL